MDESLKQLIVSMRYQPTTVGNMMVDPDGGYCSYEAVEILNAKVAEQAAEIAKYQATPQYKEARKAQVAVLQEQLTDEQAKAAELEETILRRAGDFGELSVKYVAEQHKVTVLTDALTPMTKGLHWLDTNDVAKAKEALAIVKEMK